MLATAAMAAGFHATPFWTAVFSTIVGATVSILGFILQYRYRRVDRNAAELVQTQIELLKAKDEVILLQLQTIESLSTQLTGGHKVEMLRFGESSDGSV